MRGVESPRKPYLGASGRKFLERAFVYGGFLLVDLVYF